MLDTVLDMVMVFDAVCFTVLIADEIRWSLSRLRRWSSSAGESHPHALREPDVSLSTHPAPIAPTGDPLNQWANRFGWRDLTPRNQPHARFACPRSLLYFRCDHRTINGSTVRSALRSAER